MKLGFKYRLIIKSVLVVLLLSACSSPNDNATSAQQVAEMWVSKNIDKISDVMASAISEDYSSFLKPVFALALKSGMNYKYYPRKLSTDRWQVAVEASNSIDLSKVKIEKIASAVAELDLVINTKDLIVEDYTVNASNVKVSLTDK